MKWPILFIISALALILGFQIYTTMATDQTETQAYKVIKHDNDFEIRYYPSVTMAIISLEATSYRNLGHTGFGKLAKYIFGANRQNQKIAMTSPVHMQLGPTQSTMAFVMPSVFEHEHLPLPTDSSIKIQNSEPEFVAAIRFGGFANERTIQANKQKLINELIRKGLSFHDDFRVLGYKPPFQLFGRRNEIIVTVRENEVEELQ